MIFFKLEINFLGTTSNIIMNGILALLMNNINTNTVISIIIIDK